MEFLRLVQQVGMLEESAWLALPSDVLQNVQSDPNRKNNGNVNMGAGFNPLDSFFPYDPCLLRMLHQPIEKYYRVWRGVPGLDDVAEVEIDVDAGVLLDESRVVDDDVIFEISTDVLMCGSEMGLGSNGSREGVDDIVRSRSSSACSDSDSESDVSRSMTSSMHLSFSQTQSRSQSMDVSQAMSMTESVGIGLLEEREKEKVQSRGTDSRAQSMVSDCSLEEDTNNLSPHSHSHSHSRHSGALPAARVPSFSQFSGIISPPRLDPGSDRNIDLMDAGGWPIPARRPRQDSTCSNGSW